MISQYNGKVWVCLHGGIGFESCPMHATYILIFSFISLYVLNQVFPTYFTQCANYTTTLAPSKPAHPSICVEVPDVCYSPSSIVLSDSPLMSIINCSPLSSLYASPRSLSDCSSLLILSKVIQGSSSVRFLKIFTRFPAIGTCSTVPSNSHNR